MDNETDKRNSQPPNVNSSPSEEGQATTSVNEGQSSIESDNASSKSDEKSGTEQEKKNTENAEIPQNSAENGSLNGGIKSQLTDDEPLQDVPNDNIQLVEKNPEKQELTEPLTQEIVTESKAEQYDDTEFPEFDSLDDIPLDDQPQETAKPSEEQYDDNEFPEFDSLDDIPLDDQPQEKQESQQDDEQLQDVPNDNIQLVEKKPKKQKAQKQENESDENAEAVEKKSRKKKGQKQESQQDDEQLQDVPNDNIQLVAKKPKKQKAQKQDTKQAKPSSKKAKKSQEAEQVKNDERSEYNSLDDIPLDNQSQQDAEIQESVEQTGKLDKLELSDETDTKEFQEVDASQVLNDTEAVAEEDAQAAMIALQKNRAKRRDSTKKKQKAKKKTEAEKKKEKEDLKIDKFRRKSMKTAVAAATPIIYYYGLAVDRDNEVMYVTVYQVLNDSLMGKLLPQQYFALAESSSRIEELTYAQLAEVIEQCDQHPEYLFFVTLSTRMLVRQEAYKNLCKKMVTQNHNLGFVLDCATLDGLGADVISEVRSLMEQGIKIMLENVENAPIRVTTDYPADYLRLDSRYYEPENVRQTANLNMLLEFAMESAITVSANNVIRFADAKHLVSNGVSIIEGDLVSKPMRKVGLALKGKKKLDYIKKKQR